MLRSAIVKWSRRIILCIDPKVPIPVSLVPPIKDPFKVSLTDITEYEILDTSEFGAAMGATKEFEKNSYYHR